jgi:hypothetical protein
MSGPSVIEVPTSWYMRYIGDGTPYGVHGKESRSSTEKPWKNAPMQTHAQMQAVQLQVHAIQNCS